MAVENYPMPLTANQTEFLHELERIKREHPAQPRPEPSDTQALNALFGMFKDNSRFEQVMHDVEAERRRQRADADSETDVDESRSDKAST